MFSGFFRLLFWGSILYAVLPLNHSAIEQTASETTQMLTDEARQACAANPKRCADGIGDALDNLGKFQQFFDNK